VDISVVSRQSRHRRRLDPGSSGLRELVLHPVISSRQLPAAVCWTQSLWSTTFHQPGNSALSLLFNIHLPLTGIGYSTAAQASGAHCPRNGLWIRIYAARRTTPQSATLGLHPIIYVHGSLLIRDVYNK